jgi:flagellar hook-basal body complex protein FliE
VTVEDAQMAMELAAQIRTKATEATQSIFNTQV